MADSGAAATETGGRAATAGSGLRRWTQAFVLASAVGLIAALLATGVGVDRTTVALLGVVGFVCPMVFGMGYLLLPPYAGRTLADDRLAGLHLLLATTGASALFAGRLQAAPPSLFAAGAVLWSAGVATFVGALTLTVAPVVRERGPAVLRGSEYPQRSTRVATAAIPVAIAYLVVATLGLAATPRVLGVAGVTLPQVLHLYATGFATLLVFALGARLLIGFFHVDLPRTGTGIVLLLGAVAPAVLSGSLWRAPRFQVGAVIEGTAMVGYAGMVAFVALRTDRWRPGLWGVLLGALAGAAAVVAGGALAVGAGPAWLVGAHVTLVLGGFFPLTIAGYAYQFFPVTAGQFPGASDRVALATIALLAAGVGLQVGGRPGAVESVRLAGTAVSLAGALGYAWLLAGRFSRDR
ncbi:MAG: hypothetical protein ABEJ31_07795 [Haloarculaceae archaeon]